MNSDDARNQLANLLQPIIAESRRRPPPSKMGFADEDQDASLAVEAEYRRVAEALAEQLLREALARGIPHIEATSQLSELSGGAASDFVFRARANVSFVIKVQRDPKLREEALWLASRHPDVANATPWGSLFPRVLSKNLDSAPYAYAMEDFRREDGYRDLAAWIFDDQLLPAARQAQAHSLVQSVLARLSAVYESSKTVNSRPNLEGEAYLKRIVDRMERAEQLYPGFAAARVQVATESFRYWKSYVEEIRANRSRAESVFPAFETAVHGDSHPGNIIIRLRSGEAGEFHPEIRLIDPKGWTHGDYVFDLAKLSHYIELTGPVEHWGLGASCTYELTGEELDIQHLPQVPEWLKDLGGKVLERANILATALGDTGVNPRYCLAMASSLLGTVPLRWENGQESLAIMMYAEGLRWLERFCQEI